MNKRFRVLSMVASCAIVANGCFASDGLFYKASRNYDQPGLLGRVYRKEFETRMFRHPTWRQRLYYEFHDPDINETIEIYSRADGSRWLSHRRATPSLSRIIWGRILIDEQFDLKKRLDAVRITTHEVALPPEVATEVEKLWRTMLARLTEAPIARDLYMHTPTYIAFDRANNSIITGRIPIAAYGTPAYRGFVDIVTDLVNACDSGGGAADPIFAQLPSKIRRLRTRL